MNIPELRAAIARAGVKNRKLAEVIGISEQALYHKLQGNSEFKGSEIKTLAKVLDLSLEDVNTIFFSL